LRALRARSIVQSGNKEIGGAVANFKRLTLDQMPAAQADVNMDRATFVERFDGYTRIHFGADHYVDVKETPEQIRNMSKMPNA
jgi:hypothetical protein